MKVSHAILGALAEPVLVLNDSLRVVMANRAFYDTLMISPGELEGKSVHDLVAIETLHLPLKYVLDAVVAHDCCAEGLEIECALPPSQHLVLLLNVRRVQTEEGQANLVLVELRDITREKEHERIIMELNAALQQHGAKLQGINEELESFTHSASHDLRTPLRLTNKIAYLLLQDHGAQLPPGAAGKIHMILDSTREMGKLIEDFLAFAEVKHEPMKKQRVDLRRPAREAIRELRGEQQGRTLEIVVDDLPPCDADRALLKQVFLNLLANALQLTRPCESAEIRVGYRESGDNTVYFVQDNGVRLEVQHAESIFLPFHRLHKAHYFEGWGIGLALVKRIVEHHAGRIWAESEPGERTTFYFTLCE